MKANGDTVTSQVITTHPAAYDTINYAKWYSEWGIIAVTGVTISPDTISISAGDTSRLKAIFVPSYATNKKVTWNSGNTSIATIDSTGLLTAVANGTTTITVTTADGAFTYTSSVTVTPLAVTGVSVSPTTDSIYIGAVTQLKATLTPLHPTNKKVTWSTSNAAVATVSTTGLVKGVAAGTATIMVTTADGSFTAASVVTVSQSSPIYINPGGPSVGNYVADKYFIGGSPYTNPNKITATQITSNPPPIAIFSTERYGSFSYTIPNRPVTVPQMVTLYFAETYVTGAGQRLFSMSINSTTVLSNFDIYASAGGPNKGIAKTFYIKADSLGQLVINVVTITQSPKINGIAVMDSGSIVAYAGADQKVTDTENSGSVSVSLDGSGSLGSISSYVWKEGTTQIATGVKPSVSLAVGVHTITLLLTDNRGDTASDNVIITVIAGPSSIKDFNNKGISICPNPVNSILNVALPGSRSLISLYNIEGQQLLNMNTEGANINIDMTKYLSGVYFLRICNPGQSVMQKIIKQ